MDRKRQTVVYGTDANFWEHVYVSLYSLLVNNRDLPLDIRILSDAPDEVFFSRVDLLHRVHPDVNIQWIAVDWQLFQDVPVSYMTIATYYRLLIGRVLPDSVERALYLDGDTVVRSSLRQLFDVDLRGNIVASVPGFSPTPHYKHAQRIGTPVGTPYFSAGVMLIDLKLWNSCAIEEECLDYLTENKSRPEKLKFADQDALNFVLYDRWLALGSTFNCTEWATPTSYQTTVFTRDNNIVTYPTDGPAIIHYSSYPKAWHAGSHHPSHTEYWRYRNQTPYANRLRQRKNQVITVMLGLPGGRTAVRGLRFIVQRVRALRRVRASA